MVGQIGRNLGVRGPDIRIRRFLRAPGARLIRQIRQRRLGTRSETTSRTGSASRARPVAAD